MRFALTALGVVGVLVLLIAVVGWRLPLRHRVTREATFRVSAPRLFALLTTPADFPQWRSGIRRVELVAPDTAGRPQFREVSRDGTILYVVTRIVPDREVVTQIAERSLPYGGSWTFQLSPAGADSTILRITENGEVYNPIFRFVSRFIVGQHSSIDRYLRDVGKRLSP